MANKLIRDGEFIRDRRGGVLDFLGSDEERTKCYAVIVECGHCGRGYYIPIMFTTRSSNIQNAIKDIKMTPKVKREKINCVLDAFEITELEKFTIDAINDHDDYLLGYIEKDSKKMEERRIAANFNEDVTVRTADEYHYYDVLARTFAPRYVGSDLIVPTRINRKELMEEFFEVAAVRYGMKREDPFFPLLYFMECGEDNKLGIKFDGKSLSYNFKGEEFVYPLDEKHLKFVEKFGLKETEKKEEYFSGKFDASKQPSRIDKFRARLQKSQKFSTQNSEPTETEPGSGQ